MRYTRREFIRHTSAVTTTVCGMTLAGCGRENGGDIESGLLVPRKNSLPEGLVVVKGSDPAAMVRAGIEELGGLEKLVQPADTVLVKPNIGFNRTPEQAANTNPEVVGEVVRLALAAGAGEVIVLDHSLHDIRAAYDRSGIAAAAGEAGANVLYVRGKEDRRFQTIPFPEGKVTKSWPVHDIVQRADVLINVPVVKDHNVARATVGLKNMMGLAGGNRGQWHTDLADRICDMNQRVRVDLTVMDGFRVMVRHGPTGGSVKDVVEKRTIAMSTDQVAVDAYGATLLELDPNEVPAVAEASRRGMGQIDLTTIDIQELSI